MSTDTRQQIETALRAFSGDDLRIASIGLLNTLGYQSEKTLDLDTTPDAFLAELDKRDRKFRKDKAVARYALEGLPNKVMAAEYRTALPDEKTLAAEIRRTQEILQRREAFLLPPREEIRVKSTAGKEEKYKDRKWEAKMTRVIDSMLGTCQGLDIAEKARD